MELDEIKQPFILKFNQRISSTQKNELSNSHLSNDISSLDSGFESLLNLSLNDDSTCSLESPSKSPKLSYEQKNITRQHSSPASPIKQPFPPPLVPSSLSTTTTTTTPNKITITPIKKQVADVNGIYYSCIKSPHKSPTNYFNTDIYIRERDTYTANLLRSPAFKTTQNFNIETTPVKKIKCKSFNNSDTIEHQQANSAITTPTEEEFLKLLFKNRTNPECLIGRCMGLEQFDILNDLNKRSMHNVLDIILNNLNASDYKNMFFVSKSWREIIKQDKKCNRERIRYIRFKKKFIESAKENIPSPGFIKETLNPKLLKRKFSVISTNQAFNELDINCLNNTCNSINELNISGNCSIQSASSIKSDTSNYFDFDSTFENSINVVDEKMVISDIITQRNYNNQQKKLSSSLSVVSPLVSNNCLNRQYSFDNEFLQNPTPLTTTGGSAKIVMSSAKICSKTSRKNLKRL